VPVVSPYDRYEDLHCMQDGASPHSAWLDSHFTGGWIGRCGPTLAWCLSKEEVYRSSVRTDDDLEQQIQDTLATVYR